MATSSMRSIIAEIDQFVESDTRISSDPTHLYPESPDDMPVPNPLGKIETGGGNEVTVSVADRAGVEEEVVHKFLEMLRNGDSLISIAAELDLDVLAAEDIYVSLKNTNYADEPALSESYASWRGNVDGPPVDNIRLSFVDADNKRIVMGESELMTMLKKNSLTSFFTAILEGVDPESDEDDDDSEDDLEERLLSMMEGEDSEGDEDEDEDEDEEAEDLSEKSLISRYYKENTYNPQTELGPSDGPSVGGADPDRQGGNWQSWQGIEPGESALSYARAYAGCLQDLLSGMNPEGLGVEFDNFLGDDLRAQATGTLDDGREMLVTVDFDSDMFRVSVPDSDGFIEMRVIRPTPLRNMSMLLQRANNLILIDEYRYNELNEMPSTPDPGFQDKGARPEVSESRRRK